METIELRPIEKEYLTILKFWRNLPEIRNRTREYRLLNMLNQEEWFEQMTHDRSTEMFAIAIGDTLVGVCGLCYIDWVSRNAEVSIYIGPEEYRKQGVATKALALLKRKAFNELNLHKLWAMVFSNNIPGQNLFDKCGYQLEGELYDHAYKEGRYYSAMLYGIYKDEE